MAGTPSNSFRRPSQQHAHFSIPVVADEICHGANGGPKAGWKETTSCGSPGFKGDPP